jgi:phage N-6-adenine-methyltransferase
MKFAIDVRKASRLLTVPDDFRRTALAFPSKVEQALALINTPEAATELLNRADAMAHYANRIKADTEVVNSIQHGKLKIEARLGELMPATPPKETGRGKKKTGGSANTSFEKHTIATYRKVAKHKHKRDTYYASVQSKNGELPREMTQAGFIRFATGTEKAGRAAHVSANTGIPEWYTPAEYIEAARAVLGKIDLDPASSDKAQATIKATKYYALKDDGLRKRWRGRVWLNPPYTSDLIAKFVDKLCEHAKQGNQALLLVNNATETKWFQKAASFCAAICFPAGRVKFLDEDGNPGSPLQGQAILYFGVDVKIFVNNFHQFGFCVRMAHADTV